MIWPLAQECAWRSVFPCLYNERQVLFDTPLNAILLDRSLAAVGEVCWVLQICLILEQLATAAWQEPLMLLRV